ncbi:glycogen/starch/alpha-glucan phosphorylase [Eubacteriales bacterium OttesenSCG-928-K08]|nr:glycogen/starch/alpha-glucan phosphorylase [Eubacteriales bacterium OttesenSCG-928-K08]
MLNIEQTMNEMEQKLINKYHTTRQEATAAQLHDTLGATIMDALGKAWFEGEQQRQNTRRAYYVSAEYMTGRMVYNNLMNLGCLEEIQKEFEQRGLDFNCFEDLEDPALGNGGLGRLAACFLDSAATLGLPLDGYGIRYKFGLFHQSFQNGWQVERADDWQRTGDPWSLRNDAQQAIVHFADVDVRAIPYDMPVVGYNSGTIGTLRLWQAEPMEEFDFPTFNAQEYDKAVHIKNQVEDITRVLYPNDSTPAGKQLRLKQQYFLSSASLQDMLRRFKRKHNDVSLLADFVSIQLNDTHPVVSIPELVRLLMLEGLEFDKAFEITQNVFCYTNHTVMVEALEKWDVSLFRQVIPEIFDIVLKINTRFCGELLKLDYKNIHNISIIQGNVVHMANLAVYGSRAVNGVARIHSDILKHDVLKNFFELYPERFQNKTNGVTQRRWLKLCNPELSSYITSRIGEDWVVDLSRLQALKAFASESDIREFNTVKLEKKKQLSNYIASREGVLLPPEFIFDVQVKRMHEYKRQLLNAFAILDTYFEIKEGRLADFTPTAYIFGAKAAPGYLRAKAVIKFINDISALINNDPAMQDKMKVVFVQNYNCSYAERIIPAADISEQISPAGTEASGTGNMKLMLNGAVTLGTFDGANVEIVEEAGVENNFIFGKSLGELNSIASKYNPVNVYNSQPRVRRVVDALDSGLFLRSYEYDELKQSLLTGGRYGKPDQYFVLLEMMDYISRKMEANKAYQNRTEFGRMCLMNTASAGKFSSDRTILDYANAIWHIQKL